jgi:hypothetical protein
MDIWKIFLRRRTKGKQGVEQRENTGMKTYTIEVQRYKAAASHHGLVNIKLDALLVPRATPEGQEPAHVLSMSEADARSLMLLLKAQFLEIDKRKARSQR